MADKITFLASMPPIQSAIRVTGDGAGMRLQIDIPETEMGEAVKLLLYRQVPFKVTIEPYEQENSQTGTIAGTAGGRTLKRTTAKKRDR